MYNKNKEKLMYFLISCITSIITILLNSVVIMLGWNALMPFLFGISTLHFGQSILLYLFIRVLFKNSTHSVFDSNQNN